jgi:hypothetical protein
MKQETENSLDRPEGVKQHENGYWYKELPMSGLDEPLKIFNTIKPQRLEGETYVEYKIRRKFLEQEAKQKKIFYDPIAETNKAIQKEYEKISKIEDPMEKMKAMQKVDYSLRPYVKQKNKQL